MTETRAQALLKEAAVKEVEGVLGPRIDQMLERTQLLEKTVADQNVKILDQNVRMDKTIADMFEAIRLISGPKDIPGTSSDQTTRRLSPTTSTTPVVNLNNAEVGRGRYGNHTNYSGITRLAKLEFPRFNGECMKEWFCKVEQFFGMDNTPEELKVGLASMHFDGLASTWHQAVMQSEGGQNIMQDWRTYKLMLTERFEELMDDPIAELKQLQETDGIVDYHGKFELIRIRVNLSEEYLVSAYLAGLRMDTQMHIRMFQPQSVRQCLMLGKLYEKAHPKKTVSQPWSQQKGFNQGKGIIPYKKPVESKMEFPMTKEKQAEAPRKFLSQEEMSRRRAEGLCYFCDEKYTPGHYLKHKKTQLFLIDCEEDEEEDAQRMNDTEEEEVGDCAQISVNAVAGISDYRTMRVKGVHGKRALFILIDSGSTHNFMDRLVAEKLGCELKPAGLTRVKVADGSKIGVSAKIKEFQWDFQSTSFSADFMVIPLGGCDMVLGVQWLQQWGPITWDFQRLTMQFSMGQRRVLLHGIKEGSVRELKAVKLNKLKEENVQIAMISVHQEEDETPIHLAAIDIEKGEEKVVNPAISELLNEFQDVFAEPTTLPPFRENHNHKIPLLEGSNPVNQRPYRYALYQKNEIDKMVQELLMAGTIQTSSSSYASPVVLVKKKDGTWRLCVDYRALNSLTVKDRFPIPLIEDLMDELGGSKVYSKIDLRAGYHQVRMNTEDIHKTAFKTHSGHYEYIVMPFGLTNAPATFQGLMNAVFQTLLRKCVLIFFDDILVYSSSIEDHIGHLRSVFEIMRSNSLFAKMSKCAFATERVEYLGHYIQEAGVSTDPTKVQAVKEWIIPKNLKHLRGFLGLAGYYRRFVRNFGPIARPLTALTKRDSFTWTEEATGAFEELKKALCEAPVLALPRFDQPFVVETDACGNGIGAVLMQNGHPVSYISRHLKGKQLHLSIYEKELLAVVFAVQKWRHYLLIGHFIIKTDQRSLKYLLEQRLNTPIQQQWLPKLLEFDYEIQYKQGKENLVADALSRMEGSEVLHMAMTVLECDLMLQIQNGYESDPAVKQIIETLKEKSNGKKHYSWSREILRRKSKLVVPNDVILRNKILEWMHCSGTGGHSGKEVTRQRVKGLFYWKGMATDIQAYIRGCSVCQRCKYDTSAYPGLLQPLPIPDTIWTDISMDFIDGLPLSAGKSVILVVVDRLTKAAHFIALAHPYTASTVAQAFLNNIFKLHGFPRSIVSDRDAVFLSDFWRELFSLQGVSLNYSSAYHPQSDGQSEVVNRCLETYLRCMCSDQPHLWSKWLPLAEFWYNTNFHSSIQMTPFEAVYGQVPPQHLPYLPGESKVAVVARSLEEREKMMLILKFHLMRAQHRMQQVANEHRTDRTFNIGDYVFVKLQPYRQNSVFVRSNQKLAPKYYGPYEVIDRCGKVAYKLRLPEQSKVHPVFHVSQLKMVVGNVQTSTALPSVVNEDQIKEPELILERKMVQRQNRAATMVLVKWKNKPEDEASWELLFDLERRFPLFKP